jgi:hypothetical protein
VDHIEIPRTCGDPVKTAQFLDERSRPDVRDVYGKLAQGAEFLDAAVSRIRLGGMTLGEKELGRIRRIRLLMAETNALSLSSEAEAMAADAERHIRLEFLAGLLRSDRLEVRISPLAGWSPDFTVFSVSPPEGPGIGPGGPTSADATLLVGPHWFERPYPHPGPAFVVVLRGEPALIGKRRFEEAWARGHDLRAPLLSLIQEALRRGTASLTHNELTHFGATGYSLGVPGEIPGIDPV